MEDVGKLLGIWLLPMLSLSSKPKAEDVAVLVEEVVAEVDAKQALLKFSTLW